MLPKANAAQLAEILRAKAAAGSEGGAHARTTAQASADEAVEVEDWESGLGQMGGTACTHQDYAPGRLQHKCLVLHTDPVTESSTLGFVLPPELRYKVPTPPFFFF